MTNSDINLHDWQELCHYYQELCEEYPDLEIDSFSLDKWCRKKNFEFPIWFKGLPRGFQKLKKKITTSNYLMATSEMAEMASHKNVAHHRFQAASEHISDIDYFNFPCSGAGLDSLHFFKNKNAKGEIYISDINTLARNIAQYNFTLHQPHLKANYSLKSFPEDKEPLEYQKSYIYLDPARRQNGQRLQKCEYQPPLSLCIPELQKYALAQIKLSPAENIFELQENIPGWSFNVVGYEREVKEITGTWIPENESHLSCSIIDSNTSTFVSENPNPFLNSQEIEMGQFLYIPHPAVNKSGLADEIANSLNFHLLLGNDQIYGSDQLKQTPFFDHYQLVDLCAARNKDVNQTLKKHNPPRLNYRCIGLSNDEKLYKSLQKFLKQKHQAPAWTLILTNIDNSKRCLLLKPTPSSN